jgi:putative membrane protein
MTKRLSVSAALLTLALAWLGPVSALLPGPFSAHMASHMAVVALAAPLFAWGVAGTRFDPAVRHGAWFPPVPASLVELVVVWAFHTPRLHHWAGHSTAGFVLEQSLFCLSGAYLWLSALGGSPTHRDERAGAGIMALLLTSMHMTLLGALIALSPRALFAHHGPNPLSDQHLGGAIMLLIGGASYLIGGLASSVRFVRAVTRRNVRA